MRLLKVEDLTFADYPCKEDRPKYAIASHRWNSSFEATFKDIKKRRNTDGLGYQKIEAFAKYVRDNTPAIKWLWIDTCCIDRTNAVELSKSINLMFEWYCDAEICLAYLADVNAVEEKALFVRSEWFRRGWTLQELLAPHTVVFLTKSWKVIGNKGGLAHPYKGSLIGPSLEDELAMITGVPARVLHNYETSFGFSVEDRLKWIDRRTTTLDEDMSYALFGMFNVTMVANYGEGGARARRRLRAAIQQEEAQAIERTEQLRTITNWLSPPDPWTNHESARKHHEPGTGTWLLKSDQYRAWKSGTVKHLWIFGQAGCGKTVLCSTAIEDMRAHCADTPNAVQIVFYFSFSDQSKQTFENLLRSASAQIGQEEPGSSVLRQAYAKRDRTSLGLNELQKIFLTCIRSYDVVFFHVDALDECHGGNDGRLNVLARLEDLLRSAPNVQVLATSRDLPKVRNTMENVNARPVSIATRTVDSDIQRFVSTQLSRDWKLSQLDMATKDLIEQTIARRADGMFRWAYCQMEELKRSESTKPKAVRAALLALPATLDETYERMLTRIHQDNRAEALTLLKWIAYAQSPRTLGELAEASIVDPTEDPTSRGVVDTENRGSWVDTLVILAGLVLVQGSGEQIEDETLELGDMDSRRRSQDITLSHHRIEKNARVRLAHFSVQEFLESTRILQGNAMGFHLDFSRDHKLLAQSCLLYLEHYSTSPQKTSSPDDIVTFPLLEYAATSWYHHSMLQQHDESWTRELCLLTSQDNGNDWLLVHQPDRPWNKPFEDFEDREDFEDHEEKPLGQGLYYASFIGLTDVVKLLIKKGVEVNAQGGEYGNALYAATIKGYAEIVEMLLENGANPNSKESYDGSVLQAAVERGSEKIVKLLLDAGTDPNTQGGSYGSALQAATESKHTEIVKMLLEKRANANAQGGYYGSALHIASEEGHVQIVKMLIENNADPNVYGGPYGSALQAATIRGQVSTVRLLLENGADINAQTGDYGNALYAASTAGNVEMVRLLLDRGADIAAQGGDCASTLYIATERGHAEIVKLLLEQGADVNAQGGYHGNALRAAKYFGHKDIEAMLIAYDAPQP